MSKLSSPQPKNTSSAVSAEQENARGAPEYEEAFTDLAQIIAHRIRSLTSSIESCADMLSEVVDARSERELVLRILEGTARIEYVLSDLLLYGQPIQPMQLPLRVENILDGLVAMLRAEEWQLVQLEPKLSPKLQLQADPNLLRQALLALVQNAVDAVEENPGRQKKIIVGAEQKNASAVAFTVWNSGATGVENPNELLFRPFYTTKAQNLGLGLSIARRIASAHGGQLTCTLDDLKKGTCFQLMLPVDNRSKR